MRAIVVYESIYGNSRMIAAAIAEGLGDAPVIAVHEAAERALDVDLLVVGGPTHMHGMTTARSRQVAVEGVKDAQVEPGATKEPGLRGWLRDLPRNEGGLAAAFDTRIDRSPMLTGVAARGIARRLRRHGYKVESIESFFVTDTEGPLAEGELARARAWGAQLARALADELVPIGS
jgi:hypothetical protein